MRRLLTASVLKSPVLDGNKFLGHYLMATTIFCLYWRIITFGGESEKGLSLYKQSSTYTFFCSHPCLFIDWVSSYTLFLDYFIFFYFDFFRN